MVTSMKNRLGEILVEKGFITQEQLYSAIQEQKQYRQRSGHIVSLKHQPRLSTIASTEGIQRALRDNNQDFYLHNFFSTHSDVIDQPANDPD